MISHLKFDFNIDGKQYCLKTSIEHFNDRADIVAFEVVEDVAPEPEVAEEKDIDSAAPEGADAKISEGAVQNP
jgi:hypothetical protein